jgi:putative autoinducer-2 (AI-2) aldolase
VIAGGKKQPELDALKMAYNAIDQAPPVWIWDVIFSNPIHDWDDEGNQGNRARNETPEKAYEIYQTIKNTVR